MNDYTTIGEQAAIERKKFIDDEIAANSKLLRDFVHHDLVKAFKDANAKGSPYTAIDVPKKIRFLFAKPQYNQKVAHGINDKNSPYTEVWDELKAWATSEHLFIVTGHCESQHYSGDYSNHKWMAYLITKEPESVKEEVPVRPTPPATRKQIQGAGFSDIFTKPFVSGTVVTTGLYFFAKWMGWM